MTPLELATLHSQYVTQITALLHEAKIAGLNIDTIAKDALSSTEIQNLPQTTALP